MVLGNYQKIHLDVENKCSGSVYELEGPSHSCSPLQDTKQVVQSFDIQIPK